MPEPLVFTGYSKEMEHQVKTQCFISLLYSVKTKGFLEHRLTYQYRFTNKMALTFF